MAHLCVITEVLPWLETSFPQANWAWASDMPLGTVISSIFLIQEDTLWPSETRPPPMSAMDSGCHGLWVLPLVTTVPPCLPQTSVNHRRPLLWPLPAFYNLLLNIPHLLCSRSLNLTISALILKICTWAEWWQIADFARKIVFHNTTAMWTFIKWAPSANFYLIFYHVLAWI